MSNPLTTFITELFEWHTESGITGLDPSSFVSGRLDLIAPIAYCHYLQGTSVDSHFDHYFIVGLLLSVTLGASEFDGERLCFCSIHELGQFKLSPNLTVDMELNFGS